MFQRSVAQGSIDPPLVSGHHRLQARVCVPIARLSLPARATMEAAGKRRRIIGNHTVVLPEEAPAQSPTPIDDFLQYLGPEDGRARTIFCLAARGRDDCEGGRSLDASWPCDSRGCQTHAESR